VRSAVLESEFNKVCCRTEPRWWWQILGALGGNPRVTAIQPLHWSPTWGPLGKSRRKEKSQTNYAAVWSRCWPRSRRCGGTRPRRTASSWRAFTTWLRGRRAPSSSCGWALLPMTRRRCRPMSPATRRRKAAPCSPRPVGGRPTRVPRDPPALPTPDPRVLSAQPVTPAPSPSRPVPFPFRRASAPRAGRPQSPFPVSIPAGPSSPSRRASAPRPGRPQSPLVLSPVPQSPLLRPNYHGGRGSRLGRMEC